MNILSIDLTSENHYISIFYLGEYYNFEFKEEDKTKRNDWDKKIETIEANINSFDILNIDVCIYAAGPGSYTGARLAYTFLSSLEFINSTPFYAISNLSAIAANEKEMIPVIFGNNKDIFYQQDGKDVYCQDLSRVQLLGKKLIGIQPDIKALDKLIDKNSIAKSMIQIFLEDKKNILKENFPNYIKQLDYRKIDG